MPASSEHCLSLPPRALLEAAGLRRLLILQRLGQSLFQADRRSGPVLQAYPSILQTNLDPELPRGYWEPKIGYLIHPPLVRDVVANPLAAAALVLSQATDGSRCFHTDQFADGTIALTIGAFHNRGAFEEAVALAYRLRWDEPVGNYFVNVLPRSSFADEELGLLAQGMYASANAVAIQERIQLSAGDVRAVSEFVGHSLPKLGAECVQAAPFTGPFAEGGQLQFNPISGEPRSLHRIPDPTEAKLALVRGETRSFRWFRRANPPPAVEQCPGEAQTGPVRRALIFIQENCTRPRSVAEVAQAARMSVSHLHATFREKLGCAPLKYAAERRLDVAERLITQTTLSISEIAERCGFLEQSSLTRSLKRRRGVTPAKLRRLAVVSGKS